MSNHDNHHSRYLPGLEVVSSRPSLRGFVSASIAIGALVTPFYKPATLTAIPRPVDSWLRGQEPEDPIGNPCAIPRHYAPISGDLRTHSNSVSGVDTRIRVIGSPPHILRPKRRLGANYIQNFPGRITLRGSTDALSKIQSVEVFTCQVFHPLRALRATYSAPVRRASITNHQTIINSIRSSVVLRDSSLELKLAPTPMKCIGLRSKYFVTSGIAAGLRLVGDPVAYATPLYAESTSPTGPIIRC